MSFAMAGEQVVGPCILAFGRGLVCRPSGGLAGTGGAIPIRGRISDSPHIPVIIKRHSYKKEPSIAAQRKAIGDASGGAASVRQIAQQHWSFEGQGLRCAESAALRADHQGDTFRGELMPSIQAGHSQGNLHPQSRAAPRRLGCGYFHLRQSIEPCAFPNTPSLTEPKREAALIKSGRR
jgi:hypothetical protein